MAYIIQTLNPCTRVTRLLLLFNSRENRTGGLFVNSVYIAAGIKVQYHILGENKITRAIISVQKDQTTVVTGLVFA